MPEQQEWIYYELMWRSQALRGPIPLPWWAQQYFRRWVEDYDGGLFPSNEAAFCSNSLYRYWNMVGVKDARQECLIGQSGEIEPVYDEYSLSFFLFDPATRRLYVPQSPDFSGGPATLAQRWQDGYLPELVTRYTAPLGVSVEERVLATTVGIDQKSMGLARFVVTSALGAATSLWFCVSVSPAGPTGFRRHDRGRSFVDRRWLQFLRYVPAEARLEVNQHLGPVFDKPAEHFGMYGNGQGADPNFYLQFNPYTELSTRGALNGSTLVPTSTAASAKVCLPGRYRWQIRAIGSRSTFACRLTIFKAPVICRFCASLPLTCWRKTMPITGKACSTALACRHSCRPWLHICSISSASAVRRC